MVGRAPTGLPGPRARRAELSPWEGALLRDMVSPGLEHYPCYSNKLPLWSCASYMPNKLYASHTDRTHCDRVEDARTVAAGEDVPLGMGPSGLRRYLPGARGDESLLGRRFDRLSRFHHPSRATTWSAQNPAGFSLRLGAH